MRYTFDRVAKRCVIGLTFMARTSSQPTSTLAGLKSVRCVLRSEMMLTNILFFVEILYLTAS